MKAKITTENGISTIELTPENKFEVNLIESFSTESKKQNIETEFRTDYQFNTYSKHKIKISITQINN
jgi:hypothetical protein